MPLLLGTQPTIMRSFNVYWHFIGAHKLLYYPGQALADMDGSGKEYKTANSCLFFFTRTIKFDHLTSRKLYLDRVLKVLFVEQFKLITSYTMWSHEGKMKSSNMVQIDNPNKGYACIRLGVFFWPQDWMLHRSCDYIVKTTTRKDKKCKPCFIVEVPPTNNARGPRQTRYDLVSVEGSLRKSASPPRWNALDPLNLHIGELNDFLLETEGTSPD